MLPLLLLSFAIPMYYNITTRTVPTDVIEEFSLEVEQNQTLMMGPDGMLNAGDVIHIQTSITNNGRQPVHNITITDTPPINTMCIPSGLGTLLPGETATCFGVHVITQMDIDSNSFIVNSTVNGTPVTRMVDSETDLTQTTFGELSVSQMYEIDLGGDAFLTAGDVMTVTVKLMNSGTETLLNVTSENAPMGWEIEEMLPMNMSSFQYTYIITQQDLDDEMYLLNETATSIGLTSAQPVIGTSIVSTNLTRDFAGALRVSESFIFTEECANIGKAVMVVITVENVGIAPVPNVIVEDTLVGTAFVCQPMGMNNEIGSMFPMDSYTCTGAYMFTMSDIMFGYNTTLTSNATATGDTSSNTASETQTFGGPYITTYDPRVTTNPKSTWSGTTMDLAAGPIDSRPYGAWIDCVGEGGGYVNRGFITGTHSYTYTNFNFGPHVTMFEFYIGDHIVGTTIDITTNPPQAWLLGTWSFGAGFQPNFNSATGRITPVGGPAALTYFLLPRSANIISWQMRINGQELGDLIGIYYREYVELQ